MAGDTGRVAPVREERDPTIAYLAPFLAVTVTAMVTRALSGGFEWLYPLRVLTAGAVLWAFRRSYAQLRWKWSWWPILIGCVTFVVWLAFLPVGSGTNQGWSEAIRTVPTFWAITWMSFRVVGYVVTAPLAEELAFRGFLRRRLVRSDFENMPMGLFTWASFLISSALFGAFHGSLWLAGTAAGMLFALAVCRRGALGDAVQAHATTNGLIALYAFTNGRWDVWS